MFFRAIYLRCACGGPRFLARDANGVVRKGAATVRRILAAGIEQKCPHCQKVFKPPREGGII